MPTTPQVAGMAFRKDKWFEETGYRPHAGQQLAHYDNTRHRVLSNGRRWGKSMFGGKEIETMAFVRNWRGEPMRGWIIGPEYTDAEKEFRIIYDTFKKLGIDTISSKFLNNIENGNMHIATNWGFDLQCRSARHPESLVGEGLDFVLLAEAGRHRRRTFTEYVRPALSDKRGISIMSGVPEDASENALLYWGYHKGQDPNQHQWKSWRLPSWTNTAVFPGGRTDPEILEAEDDLTEDEFRRQYGGEFILKRGRVMKEWDDEVHVGNLSYNYDWPLYAACDFGYRNDWVWLWIQVDPLDHFVHVIAEQRWKFRDTEDIARVELKENILTQKLLAIYPDPSSPDDAAILRRTLGVPTKSNTGGEIKQRVQMIRSALKQRPEHLPDGHPDKKPGLIVDASCHKLIWEMREGYRWPESHQDFKNDREIPMDVDNHGPEALGRFFKGHMEQFSTVRRVSRQGSIKQFRRRAA
jgi:hypothetical protein